MPAVKPLRIGIYGGTFDPVHHGHLILARDAVESLGLTRLIFVPAAISPHKLDRQPAAPGPARLALLRAAIAGEPDFAVDACELTRAGPSYTIDTIESLLRKEPPGTELFYLIGADNVAALSTWHRLPELMKLVTFIVFARAAGPDVAASGTDFPALARRVDISATEIRKRVASGQSIRYLVPDEVRAIIAADSLYRLSAKGAEPLPPKN